MVVGGNFAIAMWAAPDKPRSVDLSTHLAKTLPPTTHTVETPEPYYMVSRRRVPTSIPRLVQSHSSSHVLLAWQIRASFICLTPMLKLLLDGSNHRTVVLSICADGHGQERHPTRRLVSHIHPPEDVVTGVCILYSMRRFDPRFWYVHQHAQGDTRG